MDFTTRELLVDAIRFLDKNHSVDVNRYNTEAGALRYKVDRVLNHGNTDINQINKGLNHVQRVEKQVDAERRKVSV